MIRPLLLFNVACVVTSLCVANGQVRVHIEDHWVLQGKGPDEILQSCERVLAAGTFDPRARIFLNSAEAYTKSVLNVPNLIFRQAVTYRDETNGDILMAKWRISEPFGKGLLILWDTAYLTQYEINLAGLQFRRDEDLTGFLSK